MDVLLRPSAPLCFAHWETLVRGKGALLVTDNTTTATNINEGYLEKTPLRGIVVKIDRSGGLISTRCVAIHLPGRLNGTADS